MQALRHLLAKFAPRSHDVMTLGRQLGEKRSAFRRASSVWCGAAELA
jgi:hypothetical protein